MWLCKFILTSPLVEGARMAAAAANSQQIDEEMAATEPWLNAQNFACSSEKTAEGCDPCTALYDVKAGVAVINTLQQFANSADALETMALTSAMAFLVPIGFDRGMSPEQFNKEHWPNFMGWTHEVEYSALAAPKYESLVEGAYQQLPSPAKYNDFMENAVEETLAEVVNGPKAPFKVGRPSSSTAKSAADPGGSHRSSSKQREKETEVVDRPHWRYLPEEDLEYYYGEHYTRRQRPTISKIDRFTNALSGYFRWPEPDESVSIAPTIKIKKAETHKNRMRAVALAFVDWKGVTSKVVIDFHFFGPCPNVYLDWCIAAAGLDVYEENRRPKCFIASDKMTSAGKLNLSQRRNISVKDGGDKQRLERQNHPVQLEAMERLRKIFKSTVWMVEEVERTGVLLGSVVKIDLRSNFLPIGVALSQLQALILRSDHPIYREKDVKWTGKFEAKEMSLERIMHICSYAEGSPLFGWRPTVKNNVSYQKCFFTEEMVAKGES